MIQFPAMSPQRHIRLTFAATGESVVAEMLDGEAPLICQHVWDLLPLEQAMIHGQYSGAEIFALLEDAKPPAAENQVQIPLPGELCYFFEPGGSVAGRSKPVSEICIVYGRGVILRGHEGAPTHASLFARIPGDWKYDWLEFAKACRRVRWEGPQRLRIERYE
jgi:hypothetical protein